MKVLNTSVAIYAIASILIILHLLQTLSSILIAKYDNLLKKQTNLQRQKEGLKRGFCLVLFEMFYQGVGQLLFLLNHVFLVPIFVLFAEIERCTSADKQTEETAIYQFTCLQNEHTWSLSFSIIGTFSAILLAIFTSFFINSQFSSPDKLPHSTWEPKTRGFLILLKFILVFHYDLFDPKYRVAFRIGAFYVFYQILQIKLEQPRTYDRVVHFIDYFFYSMIAVLLGIVILQDLGVLSPISLTRELLPLLFLLAIFILFIMVSRENQNINEVSSRDNRDIDLFEQESEMELYINILLEQLQNLTEGGDGSKSSEEYASSPQIFTVISRHMEHCKNEECICKKYEPEFDRKFSSFVFSSRRLTKRQSSSNGSVLGGTVGGGGVESSHLRRKIPSKISYQSKCQIFKAEIADCLERFLSAPQCRGGGAGVGLKLQKSYFYHAYMNSSYKALFVQLENSYACNSFRGKVHIYHLKTRIQDEMTQSDASPLSSLDISTCLKFESRRILFEQRIVDLCLACESFWSELINKNSAQNLKSKSNGQMYQNYVQDFEDVGGDQLNQREQRDLQQIEQLELMKEINDDYNVDKMSSTLLDIAAIVIDIKALFTELCKMNPQSVAVLQCYVLVYRYILRDEYRFEEIVNNLSQLYRTNKLEQQRDTNPMFCDSDDYSMLLVSGDIKDLGRIMRVNRGVDQLFGYSPDELKGSKINKLMPELYQVVHEDFMQSFLKRGSSSFVDKNQFIPAQSKLGFLTMTLAYVKAMVDLKHGLMFVAFFKQPLKVPLTYESKDGGCQAQSGASFVKVKDAHYLLCDGHGNIQNMSQNCMRNLGLPPSLIHKTNTGSTASMQSKKANTISPSKLDLGAKLGQNQTAHLSSETPSFTNIQYFAQNILEAEYEFDLIKGMNFVFDSSGLKTDKALAREFGEIKNRMCRYNISVTLRRTEYKLRSRQQAHSRSYTLHEVLLFTIVINSYSFTDTPNILIPVFRDDDEQVAQVMIPILHHSNSNAGSQNDEMRTSKFKEFKVQVQDLKLPSKVSRLRKITFGFFIFLLGVFSLNYAISENQNQTFKERVNVLEILYQLTEKVPSTARYARNVLNIANGLEPAVDEVLDGVISKGEDRFAFYMRRIAENAEDFRSIQQEIYTNYQSDLSYDVIDKGAGSGKEGIEKLKLMDLQTDYTIRVIDSTLSSGINLYLSKALKLSKCSKSDLANITVPFLDFRFSAAGPLTPISSLQQDLYFILQNGQHSLLQVLQNLSRWSQDQVNEEKRTFSLVSLGIAIASMIAIIVVVVPLVYPLLTHYEVLAEIILHALNKLTKHFVENEVKCCNQLYDYISHKTESDSAANKAAQKKESDEGYEDTMKALRRTQSRKRRGQAVKWSSPQSPKKSSATGLNLISLEDVGEERRGLLSKQGQKKWDFSSSLEESDMPSVNKTGVGEGGNNSSQVLRRYARRGHMPPIMRRPSFYERMKEVPEFDSFREDDSQSNNSSMSNYTHQDYHTQQIQAIKDMGLLDPNKDENSGLLNMFELSQAKSSEIQSEPLYMRDSREEQKQKIIIRKRKDLIKAAMKSSRCQKLVSVSLFVIAISIYLAINTLYTQYVYYYEQTLFGNLQTIDRRMLCYPYSLTVLKEIISGNQSSSTIRPNSENDRSQIVQCYKNEKDFTDLILGTSNVTSNIEALTSRYIVIAQSLASDKLCLTLQKQIDKKNLVISDPNMIYMKQSCRKVQNGINLLGLHEVLNFILREEEKIALDFRKPSLIYGQKSREELLNSSLTQQETLMDIFIQTAFRYERISLIQEIKAFSAYLFRVFDVLFGIFVGALCVAVGYVGLVYLRQNLQKRIVQIYHIVLLIPYGEKTKRDLNELIKIDL